MIDGVIDIIRLLLQDVTPTARAFTFGCIVGACCISIPSYFSIQSLNKEKIQLIQAIEKQKEFMLETLIAEKRELINQVRKQS